MSPYLFAITAAAFPVGTRVIFTADTDRFPHFIVPEGTTGTVTVSDEWGVWVKVDAFIDGLSNSRDWQGEFHFSPNDQDLGEPPPFQAVAALDPIPFHAGNPFGGLS